MRTKMDHIAHGVVNDGYDSFCCLNQVPIGEVRGSRRRAVAPVREQLCCSALMFDPIEMSGVNNLAS